MIHPAVPLHRVSEERAVGCLSALLAVREERPTSSDHGIVPSELLPLPLVR